VIPDAAVEAAWDKLHENPARPIGIDYSELEAALEAAAQCMGQAVLSPRLSGRTRVTIPDEAVEAAARAEFSDWDTNGDEWWRGMVRGRQRKSLEAAAPHMLADAWNMGYDTGLTHDFEATTQPQNPHSKEYK